jgi:hypothetical protein
VKIWTCSLALILVAIALVLAPASHGDTVTATIGCASALNTSQGVDTACDGVDGNPATIDTTGGYSSTGILVTLTSINGLVITPSGQPIAEDLDPSSPEQWLLVFGNGSFTITDQTDSDFQVTGTYVVSGASADSVTFDMTPSTVMFATEDGSITLTQQTPDASGTATITYTGDPTVTGVSISSAFPNLVPTPEPPTIWLLAFGLPAISLLKGLWRTA